MLAHCESIRLAVRETVSSKCSYCGQVGTHPFCELVKQVMSMPNDELLRTWESLGSFGLGGYYDKENEILMTTWSDILYEEVCKRKL